jgi:hypothetical protein
MSAERIAKIKDEGRDLDYGILEEMGKQIAHKEKITPLKLEKEGPTKGG